MDQRRYELSPPREGEDSRNYSRMGRGEYRSRERSLGRGRESYRPREDFDDMRRGGRGDGGREREDQQYKAFVGGLPRDLDDQGFRAIFRDFDPIDGRLQKDRVTGNPRGFGFIWFRDERTLQSVIREFHDRELEEGRRISVVKAIPQGMTAPGVPADAIRRGDYQSSREYQRRDYGRSAGREGGRYGGSRGDRDRGVGSRYGNGQYRPGYGYDGPSSRYDRDEGGRSRGREAYRSDRYGAERHGSNRYGSTKYGGERFPSRDPDREYRRSASYHNSPSRPTERRGYPARSHSNGRGMYKGDTGGRYNDNYGTSRGFDRR